MRPTEDKSKIARVSYRIIYGDTDCGGVVYYGNYLRLFEIGRTELLRTQGLTYRQVEESEDLLLPVVEAYVRYRRPAHYDDLVEIETRVTEVKPHKVRFDYRIYRTHQLLTEGFTVHVPVSRRGKLTKFPAHILKCLESLRDSTESESQ